MEAAEKLPAHLKYVAYRLGPPQSVTPQQNHKDLGRELTYEDIVYSVLENGWPKTDAQLILYLDLMFEGAWAKKVRQAAELPLGAVIDPRVMRFNSSYKAFDDSRVMSPLCVARSRQLQSRRDMPGALNELRTVLAISRLLESKASSFGFHVGRGTERTALAAWPSWLEGAGRDVPVLRAALRSLLQHQAAKPNSAEALKSEYLAINNTLAMPESFNRYSRTELEAAALIELRKAPWEQERERRLINLVFQAQFQLLDEPFWDSSNSMVHRPIHGPAADWTDEKWNRIGRQSALVWDLIPVTTYHMRRGKATSQRDLSATILLTALALYQAENSRPAARLEDISPRYLKAIPDDPVTGKPFQYRISAGEEIEGFPLPSGQSLTRQQLAKGQGVLWSEAPDAPFDPALAAQRICYYAVPVWNDGKRKK